MKPAKFDYFAPATLDEALELLAQHGADAKVLAGGQSLMPMMNLRLVRPAVVVDINRDPGAIRDFCGRRDNHYRCPRPSEAAAGIGCHSGRLPHDDRSHWPYRALPDP